MSNQVKAVLYAVVGVALFLLIFTGFVIAAPNMLDIGARVIGSSSAVVALAVARQFYLIDKDEEN